jgi:hypothetical protein
MTVRNRRNPHRCWLASPAPCATAPFKDWVVPAAMERVRRKLAGADDGNRQMVDILTALLTDGLPAIEVACAEATAQGVHSADVMVAVFRARLDWRREPRSISRRECKFKLPAFRARLVWPAMTPPAKP